MSEIQELSSNALAHEADSLDSALQRGELFSANCPSRNVFKHVTSLWGVLVLIVLLDGIHRFSEIRRKVNGVSEKMLAQTLQNLEADGFVLRKVYPVVPPHVEYKLTALGVEIANHVKALADLIETNFPHIAALQSARHAGNDSKRQ